MFFRTYHPLLPLFPYLPYIFQFFLFIIELFINSLLFFFELPMKHPLYILRFAIIAYFHKSLSYLWIRPLFLRASTTYYFPAKFTNFINLSFTNFLCLMISFRISQSKYCISSPVTSIFTRYIIA